MKADHWAIQLNIRIFQLEATEIHKFQKMVTGNVQYI